MQLEAKQAEYAQFEQEEKIKLFSLEMLIDNGPSFENDYVYWVFFTMRVVKVCFSCRGGSAQRLRIPHQVTVSHSIRLLPIEWCKHLVSVINTTAGCFFVIPVK